MSRDTYSRGDPERGCGMMIVVFGIGSLLAWAAIWWFFGLQAVVLLVLASLAAIALINVWAWNQRR